MPRSSRAGADTFVGSAIFGSPGYTIRAMRSEIARGREARRHAGD